MKIAFVLFISLTLCGCTTYRPIPTDAEHRPFRSYVTNEMQEDKKSTYDISHATRALSAYMAVTIGALRDRANRSWDTSDLTTVGGTAAVLGGVADKTGLLNSGLFLAGVGLSTSNRFKQEQQVDLSLATFNRLSCMHGRLGMLTPDALRLARTSGDQGAIDAISSAPEDVIRNVEYVQHTHLSGFYSLRASTPSKTDLVDYFGRYNAVQTAAAAAGASVRTAKSPESEAAAKLLRTLAVELEACAKLS
ncbi:hypothetical protein [Acidovorax sp.]|uniref:hypothetical protein n=1 Tax=Acidovorax sp. TaxID=1872122 RepID=UPI002629B1EB|nr:hypothetical protein [Acidovorax sp.]